MTETPPTTVWVVTDVSRQGKIVGVYSTESAAHDKAGQSRGYETDEFVVERVAKAAGK